MTQVLFHPVTLDSMENLFGYGYFANTSEEPVPPPEPPATNRPLLNEADTNMTNQLFSNLEDPHLLESLTQFHSEPAPNLFGSSSHYGHPEMDVQRALGLFHHQSQAYSSSPISAPAHQLTFDNHVANHARGSYETPQDQPAARSHNRSQSGFPAKHEQQASTPSKQERSSSSDFTTVAIGGNAYKSTVRNMLSDGRENRPDLYMERRMTFTYGSDMNFKGASYTPPPHLKKHQELLEQQKIQIVHNGYKAPLRPTSQPSSSSNAADNEPQPARARATESDADETRHETDESSPRKRRRVERSEDPSDLGTPTPRKKARSSRSTAPTGTYAAVPNKAASDEPTSSGTTAEDKAGSGGGASSSTHKDSETNTSNRNARVNLTEDEKKMNHIRSEQKRRNQIKEGFADLAEMIPDAANVGPSKCTILAKAVDWLEGLIEGNKRLREQLARLDRDR